MAPPPEHDKEPKAPDKIGISGNIDESKTLQNQTAELFVNSEPSKPSSSYTNSESDENKHVETLDDGQLRALLDEAITYKCPKDREGKSTLFKELLEKVERQDDQATTAASRGWGVRSVRVKQGAKNRRGLPHSNSLQDLVDALAAERAHRTRGRHHTHHASQQSQAPVSARTHHGGSLPSGVDTSFLLGEEPVRCGAAEYVATVLCVNPAPLSERRVSASDAHSHLETEPLTRRSKTSTGPMTYTARATLEIGSTQGRALTTTTASNQVDSGIPFSCITTPEVVTSCSSSAAATTQQSTIAVDPKPLQLSSEYWSVTSLTGEMYAGVSPPRRGGADPTAPFTHTDPRRLIQPRNTIATTFNGLPLSRPNYSSTATSSTDEFKKSTDENGNSVQGLNTSSSGSSQHKKPRRKKPSRNETVITSDSIDGYQGNKDLNELLKFIESNADNNRSQKLGRVHAKHKDDSDERTKKRSSDRRRDKERVKRASSLEEVSRTTIEELTTPRRTRAPADSQRRSWGDDYRVPSTPTTPATPATPASTPSSDKKKNNTKHTQIEREPGDVPVELTEFQTVTKRKKQRKRGVESAVPPPAARRATPSPRRKSAPPSDRSGDSTDDMESVHSLPARPAPPAAPVSYADIARTRHNIPDLIESCNYYTEDGTESVVPPPEEEYPALCPPRAPPPPAPPAPPDVVVRPPVILCDEPKATELDGVTFGFDINEQLLKTATTRRCDLVRESAVNVLSGLRYLPPPSPPSGVTTELIVDYVGQAWEDIIKCGSGKFQQQNYTNPESRL